MAEEPRIGDELVTTGRGDPDMGTDACVSDCEIVTEGCDAEGTLSTPDPDACDIGKEADVRLRRTLDMPIRQVLSFESKSQEFGLLGQQQSRRGLKMVL